MTPPAGPAFTRISWSDLDRSHLDGYEDRRLVQTMAWLEFLAEIQNAEPVVTVPRDRGEALSYFSCLMVKPIDLNASPEASWQVPTEALAGFDFKEPGCASSRRSSASPRIEAAPPRSSFPNRRCE